MIVVDASVAVKWFAPEDDHEAALALFDSGQQLIAPDLVVAETMHALRRKLRAGDVTEEQYVRAGADLPGYFDEIVPSASVVDEASRLSIRLDHGFYDCVYLALALTSGSRLVTADSVFEAKAVAANLSESVGQLSRELSHRHTASLTLSADVIQDIGRLSDRIQATFQALRDAHTTGERFQPVSSKIYLPAFDSPAYLRLRQLVLGLTARELAQLIGLGWYGRDYERGPLGPLIENARRLFAEHPEKDIAYIISVMGTARAGLEKLRNSSRLQNPKE